MLGRDPLHLQLSPIDLTNPRWQDDRESLQPGLGESGIHYLALEKASPDDAGTWEMGLMQSTTLISYTRERRQLHSTLDNHVDSINSPI